MNLNGKLSLSAGACSLLITLSGATAVMADELVGRWKVVSFSQEDYSPGGSTRTVVTPVRGEALFTAEGRYVIAVVPELCGAAADETAPAPIVNRRYRVSGDKLIQEVEALLAHDPGRGDSEAVHRHHCRSVVLEASPHTASRATVRQ